MEMTNMYRPSMPVFYKSSTKIVDMFCTNNFELIRGRFSGQTVRIFVREGEIVEKVFLTSKGNRISVK